MIKKAWCLRRNFCSNQSIFLVLESVDHIAYRIFTSSSEEEEWFITQKTDEPNDIEHTDSLYDPYDCLKCPDGLIISHRWLFYPHRSYP